jgi:hypothetical protein
VATSFGRWLDVAFNDAVVCTVLSAYVGWLLWRNALAWLGHDRGRSALYTALIVVCSVSLADGVRRLTHRWRWSRDQAHGRAQGRNRGVR